MWLAWRERNTLWLSKYWRTSLEPGSQLSNHSITSSLQSKIKQSFSSLKMSYLPLWPLTGGQIRDNFGCRTAKRIRNFRFPRGRWSTVGKSFNSKLLLASCQTSFFAKLSDQPTCKLLYLHLKNVIAASAHPQQHHLLCYIRHLQNTLVLDRLRDKQKYIQLICELNLLKLLQSI